MIFSSIRIFRCILSNYVGAGTTSEEPPTTQSPTSSPSPAPSSSQPSCGCGEGTRSVHKIVGGQATSPHQYPWQVGLLSTPSSVPFCGGSLISRTEVLTAAHCTEGMTPSSMAVSVGEHDITDFQATAVSVCEIIDHPSYDFPAYDFSILKLCSPVELSSSVGTVCLPGDVSETYSGQQATVTGWGTLSSGGARPDTLMEVNVTVITNQDCDASYGLSTITE